MIIIETRNQSTETRKVSHLLLVSGFWFLVTLVLCAQCYAYAVSSEELIEKAKELDGKAVVYRGEVVTDILERGAHAWLNANDGGNAIGIWCDAALGKKIKFTGDYKHRGDVIEAEGIFNRACAQHNGELDIHASRVDIIKRGSQVSERLDKDRSYLATALFLLTAFIIIRYRKRVSEPAPSDCP